MHAGKCLIIVGSTSFWVKQARRECEPVSPHGLSGGLCRARYRSEGEQQVDQQGFTQGIKDGADKVGDGDCGVYLEPEGFSWIAGPWLPIPRH